jgi:tRNA-splicing ligase RtcB
MPAARLVRVSDILSELPNPRFPISVIASTAVPTERAAVIELASFAETGTTVDALRLDHPDLYGPDAALERVVCTPDFHKGAGIPIGTVSVSRGFAIPQAVGNDVGCGMRLVATSLTEDDVRRRLDDLEQEARHVFFEGGRRTGLTASERQAVIEQGPPALLTLNRHPAPRDLGLWDLATAALADPRRTHTSVAATSPGVFDDWVRPDQAGIGYDAVLGTIGGSNHFVEIQVVSRVIDPHAAHLLSLSRGQICVMAHSGSRSLGHIAGAIGVAATRASWPAGRPHPANGILPLPVSGAGHLARWLAAVAGAANFAAANRFVLTLMAVRSLQRATDRDAGATLVWDAPHNLVWTDGDRYIHRKGATPAGGGDAVATGPYAALAGEPVLVPGSMGTSSWILVGTGSPLSCASACHGAGRAVARNQARRTDNAKIDEFLQRFRIITPLDPRRADVARRPEILDRWRHQLAEEAPWAYKAVGPVVETLEHAGIARRVVELEPLATIKA